MPKKLRRVIACDCSGTPTFSLGLLGSLPYAWQRYAAAYDAGLLQIGLGFHRFMPV